MFRCVGITCPRVRKRDFFGLCGSDRVKTGPTFRHRRSAVSRCKPPHRRMLDIRFGRVAERDQTRDPPTKASSIPSSSTEADAIIRSAIPTSHESGPFFPDEAACASRASRIARYARAEAHGNIRRCPAGGSIRRTLLVWGWLQVSKTIVPEVGSTF